MTTINQEKVALDYDRVNQFRNWNDQTRDFITYETDRKPVCSYEAK
jgi:hypothetical protein